jgi:prephenate dehydrogenase
MERVAICGVGLIGGSFALALRRAGFAGSIVGVSSERTIAEAVELGVVERGVSLEEAAQTADLVYLAQPILKILEGMPALGRMLGPQATVTDAGSTKAQIVAAMREHLPAGQYVGGHPMAGKETRGVRGADAALFRGRTYVLTAEHWLRGWVEKMGARVVILGPEEHDRAVAYTSHLTQLVATALAGTVTKALPGDEIQVSGPGLIDTTRLAQSPYEIWRDILLTNRGPVDQALADMIAKLEEMRQALGENEAQFAEGAELRRRILRSVNFS